MQFQVPKFLERETKILGPLGFKQFGVVGGLGVFSIILYYLFPKGIAFLAIFFLWGITLSLMLVKIRGVRLYVIIVRSLGYFVSPRVYLWGKKEVFKPIKMIEEKEKEEEITPLKISPQSRLKEISAKIEIGET